MRLNVTVFTYFQSIHTDCSMLQTFCVKGNHPSANHQTGTCVCVIIEREVTDWQLLYVYYNSHAF